MRRPAPSLDADTVENLVAVLKGLATDKHVPGKYRDPWCLGAGGIIAGRLPDDGAERYSESSSCSAGSGCASLSESARASWKASTRSPTAPGSRKRATCTSASPWGYQRQLCVADGDAGRRRVYRRLAIAKRVANGTQSSPSSTLAPSGRPRQRGRYRFRRPHPGAGARHEYLRLLRMTTQRWQHLQLPQHRDHPI